MKDLFKKILCLLIFGVFLILFDVNCGLRETIGIPCPGCGMTRAFFSLAKLDIGEAFRYHPLFIVVLIGMVFWVFSIYDKLDTKKKRYLIIAIVILFIVVYLIRMYLYFPNIEPMDYNYSSDLYKYFKD